MSGDDQAEITRRLDEVHSRVDSRLDRGLAAAQSEALREEVVTVPLAGVLPGDGSDAGENLWLELAGFGEPGISIEPDEIDEIVYGH